MQKIWLNITRYNMPKVSNFLHIFYIYLDSFMYVNLRQPIDIKIFKTNICMYLTLVELYCIQLKLLHFLHFWLTYICSTQKYLIWIGKPPKIRAQRIIWDSSKQAYACIYVCIYVCKYIYKDVIMWLKLKDLKESEKSHYDNIIKSSIQFS